MNGAVSKTVEPLWGSEGSNPSLSAEKEEEPADIVSGLFLLNEEPFDLLPLLGVLTGLFGTQFFEIPKLPSHCR